MTVGYFTITDLMNLKILSDNQRIQSDMIGDLIQSDLSSKFKSDMSTSVNYYNSKHDILDYIRKYLRDGVLQENKGKANNKIPHPFHKILVDEKTAYITGNPLTVGIAGEENGEAVATEYRKELLNIMTERFDDIVSDWVAGASKKAVEWIHFYIDGEGELNFIIVPAEQIIPVYDTQYQNKLLYVIRFYETTFLSGGKSEVRYKVEFWDKDGIEYWTQIEEGLYALDNYYQNNPSSHWYEFDTKNPSEKEGHSWGRVPFIPLWNNSDLTNDLAPIKPLIDAYDKVKSGWANDLDDFAELIYVVKGYTQSSQEVKAGLTELASIVKNLKEDGAVAVEADGAVTSLKAEIPVEAKEKFLDITGREIIYFGEGSDVTADLLSKSHAPSGVALQFLYARLDQKCNRLTRKLQSALKDFVWFVTEYINVTKGKSFDPTTVTFTLNKAQVFNEAEKIQSLVASKGMLSNITILENHPFIDDVESELQRIEAQGGLEKEEEKEEVEEKDSMMEDENVPDGKAV